ncbi:MAG: SDR family oxidoreductase [Proteobacteria bacterium]|nr:SDR family oxidoreductase [Pseudomonadota bacterium]
MAQLRNYQPLGIGKVDDIASVVAFIASDEAKWMTGSIITMDGGASAR